MKKLIKVLEKDIKHGIRNDPVRCPIALVVRRARIMPKALVLVGENCLSRDKTWVYSKRVARFIFSFDDGYPVESFSFLARKEKEE